MSALCPTSLDRYTTEDEKRSMAFQETYHQKHRQKSINQALLPKAWIFTDPVKLPDLSGVFKSLPRNKSIGLVIRAATIDQEKILIAQAKAAVRNHTIMGYVIRQSPWHTGRLSTGLVRSGCLGWHITEHSSRSRLHAISTGWHLWAEPLSRVRARLGSNKYSGQNIVFISPVFQTTSHPENQHTLGPCRYALAARHIWKIGLMPCALGGINEKTRRRLKAVTAHFAAIDFWHPKKGQPDQQAFRLGQTNA